MKKLILTLIAALGFVAGAHAAEGGIPWDKAPNRTTDLAALQNGAKLFVNYCLNCHSAAFMRYNRLQDLGITEQQIKDNLLFTTDKVGETMKANIDPRQAKEWFGGIPPDLTLVARSRAGHGGSGADYLYTYLRTFYRDDTKATGWNNLAFPSVAMPHVLWELQGERRPIFDKVESHDHEVEVFKGWEQITPGTMTPVQYDQAVGDLVSYMQWMAEPAQNTRVRVGVWVLLFLVMAVVFVWRLNAAYWKDVK
ncbi:ubiquinol-cytochrome c reductase cytochrome c1 subunit [Variovorax sp. HW608]|uniref:cytochrome c1 n=1 Tax=Variovorax sp. HW608 TaxID=1034889 RepID=UPI000820048E|nr:cytochrome c1 [Variovorax sp. HW608]SCK45004.1 ubiquinol-cytochrome c reductase cytochrome c1 subunit [Variovorax sp. HW608]